MFPSTINPKKDSLETIINQLELQKKMTSLIAIQSLQQNIKQFIQFTVFQEALKGKMITLQDTINPHQISAAHHISNLQEESILQKCEVSSESHSAQDSTKLTDEESTGKRSPGSRYLEARLRETIGNGVPPKVSRSKQIAKKEPKIVKQLEIARPWKCSHDVHFSKGLCRECFIKVNHNGNSKVQNKDFATIYQHLRNKVKLIVKKTNHIESQPSFTQTKNDPILVKTEVKTEYLD